jgi:hypothetical protein
VDPLPELGAGDFRGSSVFHQVVDRGGAGSLQPGVEVLQGDADVGADAGLGYLTAGDGEISKLSRFDPHIIALAFLLVRTITEYAVEDLEGGRNESRVGDPGPVEAVASLSFLVLSHLGKRHAAKG